MPKIASSNFSLRQLVALCLFGFAYFVAAKLSVSFAIIDHVAPLMWPASAVALAILVLWGLEYAPSILLASFLFTLSTGQSPLQAAGISLGHTAEALFGAYLLMSANFDPMFNRVQDSFALIITAFVSSVLSASIGVLTLALTHSIPVGQTSTIWVTWWLSNALGILIFGPFLIRWLYRPLFTKTLLEIFEGILIFGSLIGINILIFWFSTPAIAGIPSVYILLVPLIWAAMRSGPRGMTLALVITTVAIMASALTGHTPGNTNQIFLDQIFLGVITIIFLLFVSVFEERKEAINELRNHIAKLEGAIAQVQQADEAKSEFIATLAHELRNPLSPIVSALEIMERNGFQPENVAPFRTIQVHMEMLVRLLDDLLDVTRVTRKKFKLKKETVELSQILERSRETVASFYSERGHALTFDVPQEPISITGDPVRIEQIFVNILFNAAKYTNPGGSVKLSLRKAGPMARISIKDTGIGISADMFERIFEPFVQVHTESQMGTGLGLGLALTKRLIELHGGKISVISAGLGHGSEFIVELPLPRHVSLPFPTKTRLLNRDKLVQQTQPRNILVVDDNEAAAKGLGALLERLGHRVSLAFSGEESLQRADELQPEVVLLDIGMPGLDGYQVAARLRHDHDPNMVLIALTGYGQDEDKARAKMAGFNFHLTKPVGIAEVEETLSRIPKLALTK